MDEFITQTELEELEQWYAEREAEEIDPDIEVWLSNEFEYDDVVHHDEVPEEINTIVQVINSEIEKTRELKNVQRKDLVDKLLLLCNGKEIPRGAQKKLAAEFQIHRITVWRIWSRALKQIEKKEVINSDSRKKGRVGRKPKEWNLDALNAVPVEKRTTLRALATALGIGFSTCYRLIKAGKLRAHSNSIKPIVSPRNKVNRIRFIVSQIIPPTVATLPKFSQMYNVVHIDEKWFYMSQVTQRFYLFPWEDEPYRACQSKKFIPKVMFMGAVSRPMIAEDGTILRDGKIGIFPFTETEHAQRSSKNRDKGTAETKAIQSITKETIRSCLIQKVLPAIRAKWPHDACKQIWVQQDNAKPHISVDDAEFLEEATKDGFDIRLVFQPAQSPDLNILDLGFFRAIQSLQYKSFPENVDQLVESVENAYNAFDPRLLNYTWLHLQYCMLEVMKVEGGNNYKNPHNGKMQMDRQGVLPIQIEVPIDEYIHGRSYLDEVQM